MMSSYRIDGAHFTGDGTRRSAAHAWCWLSCVALAIVVTAPPAEALEIVEVRWGFDGKVVRNRFNVLSILVDNPKPEAFEGELWLRKSINVGAPVDAPLVEPVFVGPFARRWVQFYPYVNDDYVQFGLQERTPDGRRSPTIDLTRPRLGWPARVILDSDIVGSRSRLPIKGLPEALFPPFVTATDALQALLIDSVPNWDEPRRQAFLNWLHNGGVVYVLQTPGGSFPEFPAALGGLAGPLDDMSYGAGRVYRIHQPRTAMDEVRLDGLFERLPKRMKRGQNGTPEELPAFSEDAESNLGYQDTYSDGSDALASTSFLSRLRDMTRPEHNWLVLHLLFWIYIALVFPGCWLIGRRWSDYRIVYLALLSTVAVFSVLFAYVGQRGYGESTAVNSLAIVRPLPDGTADVSQWSNAFVTSGGDYEIRHQGTGAIYSTCNTNEAVNGAIQCGADARFLVDIPPFSSREFALRVQTPLQTPKFHVVDFRLNGPQLVALTLTSDQPLPETAESVVVIHGKQFYNLNRNGSSWELGILRGEAVGYLQIGQNDAYRYQYRGNFGNETRPVIEQYRELFIPLLARSLNISRMEDAIPFELPQGLVRLCYFAPLDEALFTQNPYLGKQAGWALFAIDLPLELPQLP